MTDGARRIGFLPLAGKDGAPDYLRRLSRLRWRKRFRERRLVEVDAERSASETFCPGEDWLIVLDETAIPLPGEEISPVTGRVLRAAVRAPGASPVVHTLAELERSDFSGGEDDGSPDEAPPAFGFSVSDFPPAAGEAVADYVRRLLSPATACSFPPRFGAVVFAGTFGERPEIVLRFPAGIRRLLDVGCGAGEASSALRRANPELSITGIERQPSAAERARAVLDRVITEDAGAALAGLADVGARFDAFLFADVLEHLDDPIGALSLARRLALSGATLVASVPNVGHLSLVRDLLRGRFDPVPAGLADAGHLRWFTRSSLEDALGEAGWKVVRVEPLPGAPAPDSRQFLERARSLPELDELSLTTYQWVAVARAE